MPSQTKSRRSPGERGAFGDARFVEAVESLLAGGEPFTTISVGRIADRAGMSRSSFYLHYTDKSALLIRATEDATQALFELLEGWITELETDLPQLKQAFTAVVSQYRANAPVMAALIEVAAYDPEVGDFWRERISEYVDLLRQRLVAEQKAGNLAPAVDCDARAAFLCWGVERMIAEHIAAHSEPAGDLTFASNLAETAWALIRPA